jgi:hypothetical protein
MCEEQSMMEQGSIMEIAMVKMWGLLTTEQKKEVAVMRVDKFIKILEMKINMMEEMIELKKEAIADIQKVQAMLKQ